MSYRNRKLLDLAYTQPCMLNLPGCEGGDAGEPAHSNQAIHGKGGAMKAADCFHVPSCRACHRALDQGKDMTKIERAWAWNRAFGIYLPTLFEQQLIGVK